MENQETILNDNSSHNIPNDNPTIRSIPNNINTNQNNGNELNHDDENSASNNDNNAYNPSVVNNNTENINHLISNNAENVNLLESANNSLNLLNRITSELTSIQERLREQNNQINIINSFNSAEIFNSLQRNQSINTINNLNQIRFANLINNSGNNNNNNNNLMDNRQNINRRVINISLLNKIFSDYPFQDQFLLFSSVLGLIIICWIIILNVNQELTLNYLESEDMYLNYLLINIVIFIFAWNFYLLLQNFIFGTNSEQKQENLNKNSLKFKEILLFSPFWMYCVVKYSVPNYLSTIFDGFFIVFVSVQYKINFIFSLRLYKYVKHKITNITNIHLDENQNFMFKIRIHYFIIVIYNLIFFSFLFLFLSDSDLLYKFIVLNKGLFLFFKHVEYIILSEIKYYNLVSGIGLQEECFLKHLTIKTNIKLITKVFLIINYVFFSIVLLINGIFLFSFIMLFFIVRMMLRINKLQKTLKNVKDFYRRLEAQFPKTEVEEENHECIICTETLRFARKLPCNHKFHLICLSRWIEKGFKSCPVCRKELEIENVGNNGQQQESIWSFGFRLNSSLFSWLPNINLRIIRA